MSSNALSRQLAGSERRASNSKDNRKLASHLRAYRRGRGRRKDAVSVDGGLMDVFKA